MPTTPSLSLPEARRLALAAQGFADPPPARAPDRRHLHRVLRRVGLLQIDSVNVLVRSHYLPLYSRLGPYPTALLDEEAYSRRSLFEYRAHEACLVPVSLHPALRWRMRRHLGEGTWSHMRRLAASRPGFVADVLAEVGRRGPVTAGDLGAGPVSEGPWWGWSDTKIALEWLWWTGQLAVAERRGFQRLYDLPERVLPTEVLAAPDLAPEEAHRRLLARAALALGVGTAGDLADYFRLRSDEARPRLGELVEEGHLERVAVEGWAQPAYRHRGVRLPRRVEAAALLSPFDSLVWERSRTERIFGFRYRIEIYVPERKRVHGYYVLPFLLGEELVARVDLKADRRAGALVVRAAFAEDGKGAGGRGDRGVVGPLREELARMGSWLGLERVVVEERGDLAPALRRA